MTHQDQEKESSPFPRRSLKQRIRMLRPGALPPKAQLREKPSAEPIISSEERTFIMDWDHMDIFMRRPDADCVVADDQVAADAVVDHLKHSADSAGQPPRTLAALQAAVADQQETLLALIEEHDRLTHVVCRNIQSDYMVKLGYLEIKAFDLSVTYRRLKRELALTQARLNRGEPLDQAAIQAQLDQEFAQFEAQLNHQLEDLAQALVVADCQRMTPEEQRTFRRIYRQLVKAWHPDLHPDLAPAYRRLFERAVVAYREGDLETMRVLGALLDKEGPAEPSPDQGGDLAHWQATYARNQTHITSYEDKIQALKSRYPYRYRDVLDNPSLLAQRQQEAEALIARYQEGIAAYRQRLAQWKGPDAAPPGGASDA